MSASEEGVATCAASIRWLVVKLVALSGESARAAPALPLLGRGKYTLGSFLDPRFSI